MNEETKNEWSLLGPFSCAGCHTELYACMVQRGANSGNWMMFCNDCTPSDEEFQDKCNKLWDERDGRSWDERDKQITEED